MYEGNKTVLEAGEDAQPAAWNLNRAVAELNRELKKIMQEWRDVSVAWDRTLGEPFDALEEKVIAAARKKGFTIADRHEDCDLTFGHPRNGGRFILFDPNLLVIVYYDYQETDYEGDMGFLQTLRCIRAVPL